eukprot:jgi/Hompol1/2720/HPOL_005710-RA
MNQAIQFAKDQNDDELWEEFLKYSMDKPAFIVGLLENLSAHIDPLRVIKLIPKGLKIPGLRAALIKIMTDCSVQKSLREGCEKILMSDTWEGFQTLHRLQRRGMKISEEVLCSMCDRPAISQDSGDAADLVAFFCKHAFHETCLAESASHLGEKKAAAAPPTAQSAVATSKGSLIEATTGTIATSATATSISNMERAIDVVYKRYDGGSKVLAPLVPRVLPPPPFRPGLVCPICHGPKK